MSVSVKVEHINPFIQATSLTFTTMVKGDAKPGKMRLKSGEKIHYDVTGTIALSGGAKGSVALGFPRITALKVISAFVGDKVLQLDKDALDAIGELANIVAGSAKQDLSRFSIAIGLPVVHVGENRNKELFADVPEFVVPFETPYGPFDMILRFKSEL